MKNRLAELRNRAGLSQAELGAALAVSRQTVNAVEKERFVLTGPEVTNQ
ncbi:helix-turn-helix transcriptional regulator [Arthrobacter sp. G119Y2]